MQTAYKRGSRGRKRKRKRKKKKKRREEKKAAAARVCVCLCCRLRATANTLHIRSRQTLLLHQKMPRYDDREGSAKLYVGRLSSRTRSRDLEDLFRKYGRVREVDMKHDFAFIEFSDRRDADDARHYLNGKDVDGSRIIVEFARRGPRGPGAVREYDGRGPPGTGRCYNCGNEGHWARDCKAGDWKDKCYRCGQRGHIERNCRNSPRPSSRSRLSRSLSRSPSRGCSRSRSYSRSPKRDNRSPLKDNRAHSLSASPGRGDVQSRSLSPVADVRSPRLSPLPHDTSRSISGSPRKRSVTPLSGAENGSQ